MAATLTRRVYRWMPAAEEWPEASRTPPQRCAQPIRSVGGNRSSRWALNEGGIALWLIPRVHVRVSVLYYSSTLLLYDSATLRLYDSTTLTLRLYDSTTLLLYGSTTLRLCCAP